MDTEQATNPTNMASGQQPSQSKTIRDRKTLFQFLLSLGLGVLIIVTLAYSGYHNIARIG